MIGFRNNRPLLKLGDCLITEYGEQWLADALEHAARRAGTTLPFKEDLLASVRYYLEHECSIKKTADHEVVHRNTILYKFNKIEQILGISINNEEDKLAILMAFKIRRLL